MLPWRRDRLLTPVFLGFLCDSAGKKSTCNAGELSSIPGLGSSLGGGKGYPLQYSGLENSMDCIVHGITKNQTRVSDFHFTSVNFQVPFLLFKRFITTELCSYSNSLNKTIYLSNESRLSQVVSRLAEQLM